MVWEQYQCAARLLLLCCANGNGFGVASTRRCGAGAGHGGVLPDESRRSEGGRRARCRRGDRRQCRSRYGRRFGRRQLRPPELCRCCRRVRQDHRWLWWHRRLWWLREFQILWRRWSEQVRRHTVCACDVRGGKCRVRWSRRRLRRHPGLRDLLLPHARLQHFEQVHDGRLHADDLPGRERRVRHFGGWLR